VVLILLLHFLSHSLGGPGDLVVSKGGWMRVEGGWWDVLLYRWSRELLGDNSLKCRDPTPLHEDHPNMPKIKCRDLTHYFFKVLANFSSKKRAWAPWAFELCTGLGPSISLDVFD
jgi:hypothetical protein